MIKYNLIWRVTYKDSVYKTSDEIKYSDIDRVNVDKFELIDRNNNVIYTINIDQGDKFFYRKRVRLGINERDEQSSSECYIVGKYTTNGKKIAFIFDNGDIVYKDSFKENTKWFYSPDLTKEEADI